MLKNLLTTITAVKDSIFGKISWITPPWINYLRHKASSRPRFFWGMGMAIILLIIAAVAGYRWYLHLPKPEYIVSQVTPPKITPLEKVLIPDTLKIDFGVISAGTLNNRPVAPLNLIGKDVVTGVTISPSIPGKWRWESDSHLVFTPSIDWPAGQQYSIQFSKNFFAPGSRMANWSADFSTLPFEAVIEDFKFYQDPVNAKLHQAVATIHFSYPVDAASLENNISLTWQSLNNGKLEFNRQQFKYTLKYDLNKRTAYLHSEPLPLPAVERYLQLTLAKGIKPESGPSAIAEDIQAKVLIPDAGSFFKVKKLETSIVRNPQDRPEQVLTIETSLGVNQTDLNKALHVYELPRDYPATAAEEVKQNYQWADPGEVTPAILALAKTVDLNVIPADRDYATLHSYKYNIAKPAFLYVTLDKGVKGSGDYSLSNNYAIILKVPEYPREIGFLHKGALLALGTEEKLSVLVRGLPSVKFTIARVLADDINHLVTQTLGDFNNPSFISYNFNQDNISQINSFIQQFDASDPAKQQYTALDLSKYLAAKNAGGPQGLFLLHATGWDTEKNIQLDGEAKRLVLMTDLGLIVKDNIDGTHDVFVQSITLGTPVKNAVVSILGKNGVPILTRNTDANGRANFPTLVDFINEREPTVYVVHNGNDVSFIPYDRFDRKLNYSRFDIGGMTNYDDSHYALSAYVFTDRGIYRPGDTAHVGIIVKQPFVLPQPAGLPLQVTVVDPRGVTVKDEKITLNDSGYLSLDFKTNATSPTGLYNISLYIVKDNHPSNLIGSASINVAEFLPDRMRISLHLSKEQTKGWISPEGLSAKIGLWNLYGAAAANHRVSGKILLSPQAVKFSEFPDYTFVDPLLNPKAPPKVFTDNLADTQTDAQGFAELDLKLDRFDKATYQLTVYGEGFEAEGGRSVTTQATALVSPLAYLVGYKPDGDLNYIQQNAARSVRFIAVNSRLMQQALGNLKIQLFSLHPVTTLVKNDDGTYKYQSITQTTQLGSEAFALSAQGNDYLLSTKTIGDFLLTVTDENNTELTRFKYSVVGNSQLPLPKNAELSVKLNKAEFAPGEEIEMQITSPYTGAGLITIERDKVYASQWFKSSTTNSIQKIRIPNDFQGNGYINIAFVRDLNSAEIFMSPLSYSVIPFSVTHKNREIQIDLNAATLARPGEAFPITYKTDKPGKIIVFAVDEGVLQVTRFEAPDPVKYFFQKRALEVSTQQIVDQILPKFIAERELSAVGGDGSAAYLNKNLNPFKRKTDAAVVYWSGIVDTDSTPRQLVYQVPDYFNGTLRIMAVAVAAEAVGSATKTAEIRGHFVINPNVPTFVAPGDEFDVTTSVANNVEGSGADASVTVELKASPQLEVIGFAKQKITIPQGQERSVRYKVRAKSMLGSAELNFTASREDKSSKMSATLSVRPAVAYSTAIKSGYAKDASKTLTLDRILYPEYRTVEAGVSASPLILMVGVDRYLNDYPYGCVEQLVSKAFPWLVMANQPWFAADTKAMTDKIQQTIQMLGQRQMTSGGFNYWPEVGSTSSNDFASVYAMHFLTEAKAQGYSVPSDVFSAGIGYLKELATQNIDSLEQARIHAYAIYILTRNEIVTTNYLTNLQVTLEQHKDYAWRTDITSAYIAATYQLLKSTEAAEKMVGFYQPQSDIRNSSDDFYDRSIANAQYLYLVARHFPDRLQKLDDKLVMSLVDALNSDSISTILSGYTSLALSTYGQYISVAGDATLSMSEISADGKQNALSAGNGMYQKVSLDFGARQLRVTNPGKQGYYYQLTQAGFDKNLPTAIIRQGIEVYREFRRADDTALSDIHLGDEIVVHIRVRAIDNQYHNNVSLVDLLPGGFEPVRSSINLQNMDYVDAREDRVIFFGGVGPDSKEIVYRIKAVNSGKYTVPPILAVSMYHPLLKSMGIASSISVTD